MMSIILSNVKQRLISTPINLTRNINEEICFILLSTLYYGISQQHFHLPGIQSHIL